MRGRDYISRFKPAKRGTCFISATGARSIFGAWAHRNRRAGMKIAFNSPVWELYSIPLSCHKDSDRRSTLCREQLYSPNHSSPSGREGRRRVWEKKERGGGMGDGDTEGRDVVTRMSMELCVWFRNNATKKPSSVTASDMQQSTVWWYCCIWKTFLRYSRI